MEYIIFNRSNLKYLIESKKKREVNLKNQITINVYKISTEPMIINMNIIIQDIVCIIYV